MLSSPEGGQDRNHIEQSFFLTATQAKLKKETLYYQAALSRVTHLPLILILESLPGNLLVLLKSK